ncbi:Uncharacterized membrane protein YcaP, DUF421 family [Salipaludibacillus aurantiacus]|uniref:Uncharacterized membrane protein YcaP, DUF421 family n=1 Tax=Salipaludibacillus aurantiacus TaxID=1601833 RepID=A0A1H9UPL5_9BACI|nr:Uncharacterized membrane protein YcaP, DUF421 family [Salipaludibacillus aurantiacus]
MIRGVIGFFLLFLLARIMGKKHITDMTFYEYIVGIAIGSIAAEMTFGTEVRISNFVVGMVLWALFPMFISHIELKSFRFRTLTEGKPAVLIENGVIYEDRLRKESLTVDELMIHLRQKDVFKLDDVESAVMEKNGQISVLKKSNAQPVTSKDMGLTAEPEHQPRIVIVDGNVMEKSLTDFGYDKEWLKDELGKQGVTSFSNVFLGQIDSSGNVYIDLFNDRKKMPQVKQKLLVAADIKKLQESLRAFSIQTENQQAKQTYLKQADQLDVLLDNLSTYIKE